MDGCDAIGSDGSLYLHVHPSTFSSNIIATEEAFANLGTSDEVREVVLNLRDTYRLDSRGLRALVDLQRSLQDRGGRLVLADVPLALRRLLEYTRLDDFFLYTETVDEYTN